MDWKNKPNLIFNKIKQQMFGKGVETFHFVDQFISTFDPNYTKTLSSHFFNLFLNKVGVFLTTQEIRNIRDLYGKSKGNALSIQRKTLSYTLIFSKMSNTPSQRRLPVWLIRLGRSWIKNMSNRWLLTLC